MEKLTDRQKEVYDFLVAETRDKGYPPSIREIGKALGISTLKGVTCHLEALERKGFIDRNSSARGIKINFLEDLFLSTHIIKLPWIGQVAAGKPILSEQSIEEYISVPKHMVGANTTGAYLLRVKGDSMIDDAIFDGDIIIVRSGMQANNGDIVVAVINGEATVKRFYKEKTKVRLQPSNDKYEPIIVKEDFQLAGKVIGLMRGEGSFGVKGSLKAA
jgi:repressor LexA